MPELKVVNRSDRSVLLLDGEELIGAKQNRVLNTSILLKPKSEITVPVSCTEQGRWGYTSPDFSYSHVVMTRGARSSKSRSVSESYEQGLGARSDQSEVWADIADLHEVAGTSSRTGAMRDAYTAKSGDLEAYLQAFSCLPRQRGCLVFINGEVAGMDLLSRETAYGTIHPQLVKSYAMDALLQGKEKSNESPDGKAEAFLQQATKCRESRFESAGEGHDYRFEGPEVIGSALVCDPHVIHTAFFKATGQDRNASMSGYLQRRRFRRGGRS